MTTQEHLTAIRTHVASFGKGDIEAIKLQCTEDVTWQPPLSRGIIPYNKKWQGREGVATYLGMLFKYLDWKSFQVLKLLGADDNHVILVGGETFVVRTTGKQIDNIFAGVFKLRDGLIEEFIFCENTEMVAWAFVPDESVVPAQ